MKKTILHDTIHREIYPNEELVAYLPRLVPSSWLHGGESRLDGQQQSMAMASLHQLQTAYGKCCGAHHWVAKTSPAGGFKKRGLNFVFQISLSLFTSSIIF
jgi:hypothetical protein